MTATLEQVQHPSSRGESPSHPGPPRLAYLPTLDSVRAIACLLVLVVHLSAVKGLDRLPQTAGVGLFFCLSGFLITRILLHSKPGLASFNAFYNRRVARIFPIYYGVLAVLALVQPSKELGWTANFSFNFLYLTGAREYFFVDAGKTSIPPIAHFWSLCVEEHFYWIWPALVWLVPRRYLTAILGAIVALTPLATYFLIQQLVARNFALPTVDGLVWRMTPTNLVGLSLGALAAVHEPRLGAVIHLGRRPVSLMPLCAFPIALLAAVAWKALPRLGLSPEVLLALKPTLLHLLCAAAFGLGLWFKPLGRIPTLKPIGRISYGLYLYHLPIYAALGLASASSVVSWQRGLLAFALTYLVAWMSFRWIEAPILKSVRQDGDPWTIGWKKLRISPGALLTFTLAGIFCIRMSSWFAENPIVPEPLRRVIIENPGAIYPGAVKAQFWMGALHLYDANGYRRTTPIPPRQPDVPRVAVLGDSNVYGVGVAADQTLAPRLARLLSTPDRPVEVLNLGIEGLQSEDALKHIRTRVLDMKPDVIVYLVNWTDYKSAGDASALPFERLQEDPTYVERFRRSLHAMKDLCDQANVDFRVAYFVGNPTGPNNRKFIHFTDQLLDAERIPYIPLDDFLTKYGGRNLSVSRWELHPNPECHRIYAEMVAAEIRDLLPPRPPDSTPPIAAP